MSPPGTLFIISAPSGTGKTSLVRALLQRPVGKRLRVSVSHTTRPKREGEVDAEHYHFCDSETFARMVARGEFLEWAEVFGNLYGTSRTVVENLRADADIILEIDCQGALQVMGKTDAVSIFILPPSLQALRTRLEGRAQDDPDSIDRRIAEAQREIASHHHYSFCIVNDDFDQALADLESIVAKRQLNPARDARSLAQDYTGDTV